MTDVSRRQLVRAAPLLAVALPFGLARVLAARRRQLLPVVRTGDVLTSRAWNDLIARVNELSAEPR